MQLCWTNKKCFLCENKKAALIQGSKFKISLHLISVKVNFSRLTKGPHITSFLIILIWWVILLGNTYFERLSFLFASTIQIVISDNIFEEETEFLDFYYTKNPRKTEIPRDKTCHLWRTLSPFQMSNLNWILHLLRMSPL